jgi:hypothetical protein
VAEQPVPLTDPNGDGAPRDTAREGSSPVSTPASTATAAGSVITDSTER